jgi:uncharacterized protein (DUF58 family)
MSSLESWPTSSLPLTARPNSIMTEASSIPERATGTGRVARAREVLRSVIQWASPPIKGVTSVVRPFGWFVISIAVTSWVAAVAFGWAEAATIAAAGGFLLVVCGLFLFGKSALEVQIELHPQRTVVGLPSNGQITVTNGSTSRLLPSRVDLVIGRALASFAIPSLGPGDVHDDIFRVSTERRGIIAVGPAQVVRADPVGVFGRVVSHADPELLYVHPRTIKVGGAGAGFLRDLEGKESADLSPSDLAFHSLREYVPGDDRRHVHWKTSARVGQLMVQQFVDTRRSRVLLILNEDSSDFACDEDFETAVSAIGSIGLEVIREGQTRTVVSGRRMIGAVSGATMLDGLSGVSSNPSGQELAHTVVLGSKYAPDASLVVIATGRMTAISALRAASRRFSLATRVVVILVGEGQAGFQKLENTLLFTITSLEDLPSVMNVVVTT